MNAPIKDTLIKDAPLIDAPIIYEESMSYRLDPELEPPSRFPTDLLIRLEKAEGNLEAVSHLQHLARRRTLKVILELVKVGTTRNAEGTQLSYSITPFLSGTITLEEVWNDLREVNQEALMDCVLDAVRRFQGLRVQDDNVIQALQHHSNAGGDSKPLLKTLIGGPDTGYHLDIKSLLESFLHPEAAKLSMCQIIDQNDGIAIRSLDDDAEIVELSQVDLDTLSKHVVLCHNDLEPRNILVKRADLKGNDGNPWYELVATIDWEVAGLFPFAYEFGLKDTCLGTSNLLFSWYSLFKKKTSTLLPAGEAHEKLIRALRIIDQSNRKSIPRNVGVRVRAAWIKWECLVMHADVTRVWVRKNGVADIPAFTKEDQASLENEVLKELGYI
ncbi:hypothetical protein E0Z10_g1125 [Xylaria hypoxylon]|uniref:Aminoglycoside phosphotransferase domain-containing protein n=1 Tax=Xylaria hypoxylon TaxID=37992 RepID=A0A4Z0Z7V9_9PEZI|nr:hypothetical protein E0Z10_g1125 [Xylaria hypoxylon]